MTTAATDNRHLHPIFGAALAAFGPAGQAQIASAKRAAYIKALRMHDWSHEFSDDHSVYLRGREALAQLKLAQRELDADFAIWNEHAPACCRDGASYQ